MLFSLVTNLIDGISQKLFCIIKKSTGCSIVLSNCNLLYIYKKTPKQKKFTPPHVLDVTFKFLLNNNPLYIACMQRKFRQAKYILEKNIQDINELGYYRESSIFPAIRNGDIPLITLLINHGINTRIRNRSGVTLLEYTIRKNIPHPTKKVIVSLLLSSGVDLEYCTKEISPLGVVIGCKDIILVELLLSYGVKQERVSPGISALHWATYRDCDLCILKLLVTYGAGVNLHDPNGRKAVEILETTYKKDERIEYLRQLKRIQWNQNIHKYYPLKLKRISLGIFLIMSKTSRNQLPHQLLKFMSSFVTMYR